MRCLVSLTLSLLTAATLEAQVPADTGTRAIARPANDSIFRRARRLVSEGNGGAGRALVDSILRASDPATPAYGEALYWHGALAPTAAEAERDYRRVIVEYPLSYYADDALLSIAELEQARGDRAGALQHLQRFVREHPASQARGIAALGAARLAFEQHDQKTGCAMLAEARTTATTADVELRNQIEYYRGRCTGATVAAPVPAAAQPATSSTPSSVPAPSAVASAKTAATGATLPAVAPRTSAPHAAAPPGAAPTPGAETPRPTPRPPTPTREVAPPIRSSVSPVTPSASPSKASATRARTAYTIQVAAYNARQDAERLVSKLAARGVKARVSGTSKPFRVRLGFYDTRQAAGDEVAALKKRGIIGFVAEEPRPGEARSP